MGQRFGIALRQARTARSVTQEAIAAELEISHPAVNQWESGKTLPTIRNLKGLERFLNAKLEEAWRDDQEVGTPTDESTLVDEVYEVSRGAISDLTTKRDGKSNVRRAPDAPSYRQAALGRGVSKVEVRGQTAAGPRGGDFRFNGQVVDYAQRPRRIANRKNVFALYVVGESMHPRYKNNNLVYADPDQVPSIGDDVIVELKASDDGSEAGDSYIKTLKRRTAGTIIVEQYNPAKDIEFNLSEVRQVIRVIPYSELLGI